MHKEQLKEKIRFYLIDCETQGGKIVDLTLIILNLLVCSLFVIETYLPEKGALFNQIDSIVVLVFIVEFILRFYASESKKRFFTAPYTIIDFLAILPTVLRWILPGSTGAFLATLRVIRLLRIFRFLRFVETETFFFGTVKEHILRVLRLMTTTAIILFLSAGLIYSVEVDLNEKLVTFGDAFYYTVVTVTTVGFGDITPVTEPGKLITVLMILSGIVFIPWQAGQIVISWVRINKKRQTTCKSCGLRYHDRDATHCKHCGTIIYQEVDG